MDEKRKDRIGHSANALAQQLLADDRSRADEVPVELDGRKAYDGWLQSSRDASDTDTRDALLAVDRDAFAEAWEHALSPEAAALGARDGIKDADTVLEEQGLAAILESLRPGQLGWDEAAINAGAHKFSKVPDEHAQTYYAAYALAARTRALVLADRGRE